MDISRACPSRHDFTACGSPQIASSIEPIQPTTNFPALSA